MHNKSEKIRFFCGIIKKVCQIRLHWEQKKEAASMRQPLLRFSISIKCYCTIDLNWALSKYLANSRSVFAFSFMAGLYSTAFLR